MIPAQEPVGVHQSRNLSGSPSASGGPRQIWATVAFPVVTAAVTLVPMFGHLVLPIPPPIYARWLEQSHGWYALAIVLLSLSLGMLGLRSQLKGWYPMMVLPATFGLMSLGVALLAHLPFYSVGYLYLQIGLFFGFVLGLGYLLALPFAPTREVT